MGAVAVSYRSKAFRVDGAADKEDCYGCAGDGQQAIDQKCNVNSRRHRRCRDNNGGIESYADGSARNLEHIDNGLVPQVRPSVGLTWALCVLRMCRP